MSDYDAAFAAATSQQGTQQADPYDAIMAGIAPQYGVNQAAPVPKKRNGSGSDLVDTGNAVGTGYFRGLTRLAGLPVDTVANVMDLGKAAIGSGYQAVTGKPAPDALQIGDRRQVVGSGDWLIDKLSQTAPGNLMLNPSNPEYEGGVAQAVGGGLNAVIRPQSAAQAVNQAILGSTSGAAGNAAYQVTGDPALAVAASLTPSGIQQAAVHGTKAAVRGANPFSSKSMDAKGAEMRQRVQDLQNAGVENPTLGLASGNRILGGVENILQSTPGAVGVMSRARDQAVSGMQRRTEEAAQTASSNRGTMESGRAIQGGLASFKDQFKQGQERLYGKLDNFIQGQTPTSVENTRKMLTELNADIPGAPEMSKFFKNGKIQSLEAALASDTGHAPKNTLQAALARNPLFDGATGQPMRPRPMPTDELPWEAVKKTRTMVGKELADSTPFSDVPRSKWNPLYGALSSDMGVAANAAGPGATHAFNRATDYTRAGMGRLDRVAPFADMKAPEQAFVAMERAARENVSTLQAVKKTLPQDARGSVAGTIIERLGRANNSSQNESGTAWSPESFLTNWNKMTPKARDELFSGFKDSAQVKSSVESVAKAASMMRDSSKMWANPSGTGANLFARGLLGAVGVGGGAASLGLLNPMVPLGIGAGMLGANGLSRALTSPDVVKAMARGSYVSPQMLGAQVAPMYSTGLLDN